MRSKVKKNTKAAPHAAKVRIIGGRWRGRLLPICEVEGLRPTGDRCRETLFNWLMAETPGSTCLDLFAGTGALGFEALSRGAQSVTLVEKHPTAFRQLATNAKMLSAEEQTTVHQIDADAFLQQNKTQFSLVFLDPPFAQNLWHSTLQSLIHNKALIEGALVYLERPTATPVSIPESLQEIKTKKAGQVTFSLFEYQSDPPVD